MTKILDAVYSKGVLRLLQPIDLPEEKLVRLTLEVDADLDDLIDDACMKQAAQLGDDSVTIESVRQALASITGDMTSDYLAERDER